MKATPLLNLEGDKLSGKVEKRKLLEDDIERPVCRYAERNGLTAEKFTSPGRRSVPDRLFTGRNALIFFIEFKAPGKTASEKQADDHDKRRKKGFRVYVVDNVEQGKRIIDAELMGLAG